MIYYINIRGGSYLIPDTVSVLLSEVLGCSDLRNVGHFNGPDESWRGRGSKIGKFMKQKAQNLS